MYKIIFIFAIVFLAIGLILAVTCVITFYSRNMAEVYDALYDRGYTSRIEKRKNRKRTKNKVTETSSMQMTVADSSRLSGLTSSFPMPAADNLGKSPMYNSGQTIPLDSNSGQTVPLTAVNANKSSESDFRITKNLHYSYTDETIM